MEDWYQILPKAQDGTLEVYRVWENTIYYQSMLRDLYSLITSTDWDFNTVATIATSGIIFAAPIAANFAKRLIVLRKDAKLPCPPTFQRAFINWRNETDSLSIEAAKLPSGLQVLLIDDVIQTGNSVEAAVDLLQAINAQVMGVIAVYNISPKTKFGAVEIKSLLNLKCA